MFFLWALVSAAAAAGSWNDGVYCTDGYIGGEAGKAFVTKIIDSLAAAKAECAAACDGNDACEAANMYYNPDRKTASCFYRSECTNHGPANGYAVYTPNKTGTCIDTLVVSGASEGAMNGIYYLDSFEGPVGTFKKNDGCAIYGDTRNFSSGHRVRVTCNGVNQPHASDLFKNMADGEFLPLGEKLETPWGATDAKMECVEGSKPDAWHWANVLKWCGSTQERCENVCTKNRMEGDYHCFSAGNCVCRIFKIKAVQKCKRYRGQGICQFLRGCNEETKISRKTKKFKTRCKGKMTY